MAVFRKCRGRIAIELERESGIVLNSTHNPETRFDLIGETATNRVALILRIWEMTAELGFRSLSVVAKFGEAPLVVPAQYR